MPVEAFDPKGVDQYIREEVTKLLGDNRIYKLGNHGWSGPDDVDPDEIGHAMWQLDDPADELLGRSWDEPRAPLKLPEWKTLSSIAGADFEGLMDAARLSIGMAIFQLERVGERLDGHDSFASVHSIAAITALGSASERLRQYFIPGVFRVSPHRYVAEGRSLKRKRHEYAEPFKEAIDVCESVPEVKTQLEELQSMAIQVVGFQKARNALIHDIATESGRLRKAVIDNADVPRASAEEWERLTDADFASFAEQERVALVQKVDEAVGQPMVWYRLLIEMANDVFYVENHLRRAWK